MALEPEPAPARPSYEEAARRLLARVVPDADLEAMSLAMNLLRTASRLAQELESEVHRPLGWTWPGFRVMLAVLAQGPLQPRQVARITGFTPASISAVLNTLERDGFVVRQRNGPDRRAVQIVLTPRGHDAVVEGFRRQNAVERQWAATLAPQERATLTALLRTLWQRAGS